MEALIRNLRMEALMAVTVNSKEDMGMFRFKQESKNQYYKKSRF
jgi:hypothetical protein